MRTRSRVAAGAGCAVGRRTRRRRCHTFRVWLPRMSRVVAPLAAIMVMSKASGLRVHGHGYPQAPRCSVSAACGSSSTLPRQCSLCAHCRGAVAFRAIVAAIIYYILMFWVSLVTRFLHAEADPSPRGRPVSHACSAFVGCVIWPWSREGTAAFIFNVRLTRHLRLPVVLVRPLTNNGNRVLQVRVS